MCVSLLAVAGRELTSSHHYANPWRHNTSSIISHTRWVRISIQSIDCRYWWVVDFALFGSVVGINTNSVMRGLIWIVTTMYLICRRHWSSLLHAAYVLYVQPMKPVTTRLHTCTCINIIHLTFIMTTYSLIHNFVNVSDFVRFGDIIGTCIRCTYSTSAHPNGQCRSNYKRSSCSPD